MFCSRRWFPKAWEVIIGVSRDPIFGPVAMFGLGGIFVEILEDIAFRSIPAEPPGRGIHGESDQGPQDSGRCARRGGRETRQRWWH